MKKFAYIICIVSLISILMGCIYKTENNTNYISVGTYVGMIDDNSIEVTINSSAMAFRLTDSTRKYFDQSIIKEDENIILIYFKNEYEQLVLKSIQKLNKSVINE